VFSNVFVHEHQKGVLHLRFEDGVTAECVFDHILKRFEHFE
jgi:hypothetical protein